MSRLRAPRATDPAQSRPAGGPWSRVRDALGGVAAAILLLLSLANCKDLVPVPPPNARVQVGAQAGQSSNSDEGPGQASTEAEDQGTGATADASGSVSAGFFGLGGPSAVVVNLSGSETHATAANEQRYCLTATHAEAPDLFLAQNYAIFVNCLGAAAGASLDAFVQIQKNGEAPISILDGSASIHCGDPAVTNSGLPQFFPAIPVRFFAQGNSNLPDVFDLQVGDRVEMVVTLSADATLPAGTGPLIEVSGTISPTFDFGLAPVSCTPPECSDTVPCSENEGAFCDDGVCKRIFFASNPGFSGSLTPNPPVPNQLVSVSIAFDVQRDDLLPRTLRFTLPAGVASVAASSPGQVFGTCAVAGVGVLLVSSGPGAFFVATPSPADPTGTIVTNGAGDTEITLSFPFDPEFLTVPGDATFTCSLNNAILYKGAGTVTGEIVSVDVTSPDGDDDGVGLAPVRIPISVAVNGATLVVNVTCGDGVLDLGEECDDADAEDGDGCSSGCAVEPGHVCAGTPSVCTPDDEDGCPDDPAKVEPGLCGCGFPDELASTPCDTGEPGVCADGTFECASGLHSCAPLSSPTDEACNGEDDDCDAETDEGGVCPEISGSLGLAAGNLNLKATLSIATIPFDPSAEGVTVRLEQDGSPVVDVQIPGGEEWKVNPKGTKWRFAGSLGQSEVTANVKCNEGQGSCVLKVIIKGTNIQVVHAGDVTTTVVIGDDRFQSVDLWVEKGKGRKRKLATTAGTEFSCSGVSAVADPSNPALGHEFAGGECNRPIASLTFVALGTSYTSFTIPMFQGASSSTNQPNDTIIGTDPERNPKKIQGARFTTAHSNPVTVRVTAKDEKGATSVQIVTIPGPGLVLTGVLPPSTGRFNYNLALGIPGANAACGTSYPGTHACGVGELENAEAAGDLRGIRDAGGTAVTSFWGIDPALGGPKQCWGGVPNSDYMYQTADHGWVGTSRQLDNVTGVLGSLKSPTPCSKSHSIGCCR